MKSRQRLFKNSKTVFDSVLNLTDLSFLFSYRGFYSRKYEHDFYARKKYLLHVETKNEEVRKNLDEHHKTTA